ncbi:ribosome hibernation-promoting factor, HPF/YfiA family [Desulfovibrio cuneatus]|uniref:ribosome hibernation-promoting factor, HPF/YfiA family n=1 Tax=Desulfovibrio cuneatus TaxID=159728 RepID=UPI000409A1C7|nr:ribosome-associated translation inhibitor RaiA [Desulfovibrio cuneatus]
MNFNITFKDFTPSDHLRKYAEQRLGKLGRFLGKAENANIHVVLSVGKLGQKADVRITADHLDVTGTEVSQDMYASIDMVLDTVTAQVKKLSERRIDKKRRAGKERDDLAAERYVLSGKGEGRQLALEGEEVADPLLPEEAAEKLQREGLEHIVFLHAEYLTVHMIYRKANGELYLIEMTE